METLEACLEQCVAHEIAHIIDKRVNSELGKIRKDIDDRLNTFKENTKSEITYDMNEVPANLYSLSSTHN